MTNPFLDALLNADAEITRKVPLKRLGVEVVVKAVDAPTFEEAKKYATTTQGSGKKAKESLNTTKLGAALVCEAVVNSPFSDQALMEKVGAMDPTECAEKVLLAGELLTLMGEIMEISGFDDDEAFIDEAKN